MYYYYYIIITMFYLLIFILVAAILTRGHCFSPDVYNLFLDCDISLIILFSWWHKIVYYRLISFFVILPYVDDNVYLMWPIVHSVKY